MLAENVENKLYGIFNPDTKELIRETDHLGAARNWIKYTNHVIVFSERAIQLDNAERGESTEYFGARNDEK